MSDLASLLPVSIVVCTRNRAESLGRTLAALAALDVASLPAVELLVVDNGSTDGTAEMVRAAAASFPYPLRLVPCPEKGLSRARNAGVAAARHELILFTDDDCLPERDWAVQLAEAYSEDPLQVIGGPVIDLPDDWDGSEAGRQEALARAWIGSRGALEGPEDVPGYLIGANFSLGRAVVTRIGPFDERLGAGTPLHAAEETDLVYRALKAGVRIRFEPAARVFHDHRRDAATLRRLLYRYNVGEGAMVMQHLLAGDNTYLRVKYWRLCSEIRQWRRGEKTLGDVFHYGAAHLDGALRMAMRIGLDRLRGRGAGASANAGTRPADRGSHA